MGFEMDVGPLITAVRQKADIRGYGFEEGLNKAAKDVALRAIGFTPSVPASVISAEVRRIVSTRTTTKTGKTLKRPKNTYSANTVAVAIMVSRLRREGKLKGLTGEQVRDMALKMANARVRSGSYLRAGYLAAAKPFGGPGSTGESHLYHAQGEGVLATPASLLASISNDVPASGHWGDHGGGALAYEAAENALQSAIDYVERDVLVYVDRKLREAGFA